MRLWKSLGWCTMFLLAAGSGAWIAAYFYSIDRLLWRGDAEAVETLDRNGVPYMLAIDRVYLGSQSDPLDPELLKAVGGATTINELVVSSDKLTDADIAILVREGNQIRRIILQATQIGDEGFKHICETCAELQQLHYSECKLSDEGLVSLHKLRNLEQLDLSGTSISDQSVDRLLSMKRLRRLELGDTRVSQAAASILETENVNLNVWWWKEPE